MGDPSVLVPAVATHQSSHHDCPGQATGRTDVITEAPADSPHRNAC